MKVFAIGISRNAGISKKKVKEGKPYEMVSLLILTPIEPGSGSAADGSGGTWERAGYGFQAADLQVEPTSMHLFKDVKFPCNLDVATDSKMQFGRMGTVVVGINSVDTKLKAA